MTTATQLEQTKRAGYELILTFKTIHKSLGTVDGRFPTFKNIVDDSIRKLTDNVNAFDFEVIEL